MRASALGLLILAASNANADGKHVFLQAADGSRLEIASLDVGSDGQYTAEMNTSVFGEHFLSMRPFKCVEGENKHWCHVPYPYDLDRDVSASWTDLEYDFLFVWKGANDYGINMWNGVYYKISQEGGKLVGELHEMDMNVLAVPPAAGDKRPIKKSDLHPSDPDSHWFPQLIIE